MKIAVFHPSSELYGADRILVSALKLFPPGTSFIVYLFQNGPLEKFIHNELPEAEVKVIPFMPIIYRKIFTPVGLIKYLVNYFKFNKFFSREQHKEKFDAIYCNTLATSLMLPVIKRSNAITFVHVHEIIEKPKFISKITAQVCRKYADKLICVSRAVADNLIQNDKRLKDSGQIEVVHNGIRSMLRDIGSAPSLKLKFLLVGRIMPKKGHWFLINTLSQLSHSELEKCHFTLIGGVPPGQEKLRKELIELIEQKGHTNYIDLKDFTEDVAFEFNQADICLVPSMMKDPFPTTVLEAMSAGKPVIATKEGGASEAIRHMHSGVLISRSNIQEFKNAIEHFIKYPETIKMMGLNAKERYIENFTVEQFKNRWKTSIGSMGL